jgi:hypothetical protein
MAGFFLPRCEHDGIKSSHHRALGFFGKPVSIFPNHALSETAPASGSGVWHLRDVPMDSRNVCLSGVRRACEVM